ncbi:MAG: hypothetical protein WAQ28_04200 [Bacteroidia bacterium]|jgi:hypothetical protein
MKAKNTLSIVAGLLITFAACKKEETPIQPAAPPDNTAYLAMENELKLVGNYVDSLSSTSNTTLKAHHDSLYHVHHDLFLQHHAQYSHTDTHDTLHHDSHTVHTQNEHNDPHHGDGHHNNHHTGHHHTLDSLHTVHLQHFTH